MQVTDAGEHQVVAALIRGEEAAFVALVNRYHASMVRVASRFVPSPAVAEEVVQETWIGLLRGIEGFGGRSSLKTWLFTILLNQARRRGAAEHRSVPFSALGGELDGPSVDPDSFFPPGHPAAGEWIAGPARWAPSAVEEALMSAEVEAAVRRSVAALPPGVAVVVTLRDLEGWTSEEVCTLLGISDANQRVRLHRGRSRVRADLVTYLGSAEP